MSWEGNWAIFAKLLALWFSGEDDLCYTFSGRNWWFSGFLRSTTAAHSGHISELQLLRCIIIKIFWISQYLNTIYFQSYQML